MTEKLHTTITLTEEIYKTQGSYALMRNTKVQTLDSAQTLALVFRHYETKWPIVCMAVNGICAVSLERSGFRENHGIYI